MSLDPNRLILTGENPFIRLTETDGGATLTNASFWRILISPFGAGHVLYLKSELTRDSWKIYSDNIAVARWLQKTVQGMLNEELLDISILVIDAVFDKTGDARDFWSERVVSHDEEVALTWYDIGEPLLIHTQPGGSTARKYGVCTVLIPALGARVAVNGVQAKGRRSRRSVTADLLAPPPWHSPRAGLNCADSSECSLPVATATCKRSNGRSRIVHG